MILSIHALLILNSLISVPVRAQIAVPSPTPVASDYQPPPWPEQIYQSAMSRLDALEYRIVNSLFDGNTEFDILNQDFTNYGSLGVRIGRNIFNNFDVMNTWTVVDTLRIRVSPRSLGAGISTPSDLTPSQILQFPFAGVSIGTSGTLELRNIRQMSPERIRTNQDLAQKSASLEALTPQGGIQDGDIEDLNPYLNSSPLDSPIRVKLSGILNPLKLPFKIPFSRKDLKNLQKGEIISYTLSGSVGLGANLGWSLSPIPVIDGGLHLGVEVHLNGAYQLLIMKEDERFVKVRLSRLRGRGSSIRVGSRVSAPDLYEGFLIFKGSKLETRLGRYSPSITPFSFSLEHTRDREIDIGYRYDLSSSEGKDAFHRAVLGSFVKSDEMAADDLEAPHPAVQRLFIRKNQRNIVNSGIHGDVNPILRFSLTRNRQEIATEIELPSGKKHYLQSRKERASSVAFIGASTQVTHRTSVLIDKDAFKAGLEDSVLLMSENSIEDSQTFAPRLNRYLRTVENVLGSQPLFPVFPDRIPKGDDSTRTRRIFYGRSSFYFGVTFKRSGLKQFLETPWSELEGRASTLGLHLQKEKFERAQEAFLSGDAAAEKEALTGLFKNQPNSELYPRLLMTGMPPQMIERFLVAQNPALGNIQIRGHTPLEMERILQSTNQSMGMGTETERTALDPDAIISSISTVLESDQRVKITFNLKNTPHFLYFRLQPFNSRRKKNAVELIVFNRDQQFKAGSNSIILDPKSPDPLIHKLSEKLDSRQTVLFTMGYSQKGSAWGFGTSTRFQTTSYYDSSPPPEPK